MERGRPWYLQAETSQRMRLALASVRKEKKNRSWWGKRRHAPFLGAVRCPVHDGRGLKLGFRNELAARGLVQVNVDASDAQSLVTE